MDKYLLAVLVDNKPGVLSHIASLISRRAFNIERHLCRLHGGKRRSRASTSLSQFASGEMRLNQVVTQLSKLIDVVRKLSILRSLTPSRVNPVIKVRATKESRADH